jgi:Chromo (CHRromatin Organisation MOdifier) domain
VFKEGDQVLLEGINLKLEHPSTKLAPRRWGPFTVIKVISLVAYQLDLPPHWCIHNSFNIALLMPYRETGEHGRNFPEPPPDLIEGESEYKVEQVMDVRTRGKSKKFEYLLRWKGYSPTHDSWEPADNVKAPELIKEFYQCNPNAEGGGRIKR